MSAELHIPEMLDGANRAFFSSLAFQAGGAMWQAGLALLRENAVLDLQPLAGGLSARVANDQGRFAEAQIRFRGPMISSSCSCRRAAPVCEHAVAGLLAASRRMPEILPTFILRSPTAEAATGEAGNVPGSSRQPAARKAGDGARLHLVLPLPGPGLFPAAGLLAVQAGIFWRGRTYGANNLRLMLDGGNAGGDMQLGDFKSAEQQVIRLLCSLGEKSARGFEMDPARFAGLLGLLGGFPNLLGDDGLPVFVLATELEIGSVRAGRRLLPRLRIPGRGALPGGAFAVLPVPGGGWVFWEREFHPLPAGAAAAALAECCQPAPPASGTVLHRKSRCRPVLALDWRGTRVYAEVFFRYGRQETPAANPAGALLWEAHHFSRRDFAEERCHLDFLSTIGFARENAAAATPNRLLMSDPATIWRLVHTDFNHAAPGWTIRFTREFEARRARCLNLRLSFSTGLAGPGWFSLKCAAEGFESRGFDWRGLWRAIQRGENFFRLPDGAVAKIPERLRKILATLHKKALEGDRDTIRFRNSSAILVEELTRGLYAGRRAPWQLLAERLAAGASKLQQAPPPGFQGELRDYQKSGLAWINLLAECGFNGILADEMGLGKTVQALAVLAARKSQAGPGANPISMIVCPTSLVENWLCEAARFTPGLRCLAVRGQRRAEIISQAGAADVLVTSYALLRRDIAKYAGRQLDYLILDEAQHIKNPRTANAKTCKALQAANRLILTGTPLENCLRDIWSLFDFLMPGHLGGQREFLAEYDSWLTADGRQAMLRALGTQVRPFMLRRSKSDVCAQLPPKTEQTLYCDLAPAQRELYSSLLLACRAEFTRACADDWEARRFHVLTALLRLRQACCHPSLLPAPKDADADAPDPAAAPSAKFELLQELILEAMDSNHRILVFSQFTSMLAIIRKWLEERSLRYEYLDGATKERQAGVDRFNRDPDIPVFLLSLKAGGTGLNLTGADTVIHYDQWWNPMVEEQATDRTHRIGQERPVTSIRLLVRDTVEEQIVRLQQKKRDMFNGLMQGLPMSPADLTQNDIAQILE